MAYGFTDDFSLERGKEYTPDLGLNPLSAAVRGLAAGGSTIATPAAFLLGGADTPEGLRPNKYDLLGQISQAGRGAIADTLKSISADAEAFRKSQTDLIKQSGLASNITYSLGYGLGVLATAGANPIMAGAQAGTSRYQAEVGEGVDKTTAQQLALVEGATFGLGVLAPAAIGRPVLQSLGFGAASNAGLGIAQRAAEGQILGDKYASRAPDVFDPVALTVDTVLGGAFGYLAGKTMKPGELDDNVLVQAIQGNANVRAMDNAPGYPTPKAFGTHKKLSEELWRAEAEGRKPDLSPILEAEFRDSGMQIQQFEQALADVAAGRMVEDRPIYDAVLPQLEAAGIYDQTQARQLSKLTSMAYTALAKRTGKTPQELFEQIPLTTLMDGMTAGLKQRAMPDAALMNWFGDSKVVNTDGTPKVVYRGEHSSTDGQLNTQLGALSFSGKDTANIYAESPNDYRHEGGYQRIIPAYVSIKNPVMNNPTDPFIDFTDIIKAVGEEKAIALARKHADQIEGTSPWQEGEAGYDSVTQMLDENPKALVDQYMLAFPLFDDPEAVAMFKAAGYDGAIHGPYGDGDETEYRPFDQSQVKSIFNSGRFDPNSKDILNQRALKPGPDRPGVGIEGNAMGFWPNLLVKVTGKAKIPEKARILTGTNNKNAAKQIAALDEILDSNSNATDSVAAWSKMMAEALGSDTVPVPPFAFIRDLNGDGSIEKLKTLTKGQIEDADHGFENAREFRQAYINGELDVTTTGKLFLWSFLSRGVSPYTQESLFIDAFDGAAEWIQKAADGKFTEADFDAYEAWAKSAAPAGSGQPGAGATHNLNAFGKNFLFRMGQVGADGRSHLQRLHDMMADPNLTGRQIRREFATFGEGVGIDNKVVSFTLLVAGFDDVMVLDRVQFRQLWDDGRYKGTNLYDGVMADGKKITGSSLNGLAEGVRGILVYEAIERGLEKRIKDIYRAVGREQDASIGRYHWETWVADSQQEASHGTIGAILSDAKGDDQAIARVSAKQGEYGAYEYGARYGRAAGKAYFDYEVRGKSFRFSVPAFRAFLGEIKKPGTGVVPGKFKVTESGNGPWYERPEVNLARLEEVAANWADIAGGNGQGQRALEEAARQQGEAANRAGGLTNEAATGTAAGELFQPGGVRGGAGRLAEQGRQDPGAREADGSLAGLPRNVGEFTARVFPRAVAVAKSYMESRGLKYDPPGTYAKVNPERARRIADEFEAMKHDPNDPEVKAAYAAMVEETKAQFQAILDTGLKIEFIDFDKMGDPYYASPRLMTEDVINNNHMWVFSTLDGFGTSAFDASASPMLADTGLKIDGKPVLVNDMFRVVHDYFGHVKEGVGFRADGEENAWRAHAAMYSPLARRAMTTETRGQNSWVNYGPFGEANRKASPDKTVFADQKVGLLPEWVSNEGRTDIEELNQGEAPRGSYSPADLRIRLTQASDVSTFVHELGHHLFEVLGKLAAEPNAPEQIRADFETLVKHGGMTVDQWRNSSLEQRREAHERVAEDFEAYLMNGKAPSLELKNLFSLVRDWMLAIYKTMAGEVKPEVSAVFDRMLATDQQLAMKRATVDLRAVAERTRVMAETDLDAHLEQAMQSVNLEATVIMDGKEVRLADLLEDDSEAEAKAVTKLVECMINVR